jgi:hypothetical protein
MLYPERLLAYVLNIRSYVDSIYITTSVPVDMLTEQDVVADILAAIDGLNVSVQATQWQLNNKLMHASSKHNRLVILKRLIEAHADKIRVNLNLTKDGIGTELKLSNALHFLETIGCKHVKLNELQNADEQYVSYEEMLRGWGPKLNLRSPYAYGCQTKLDTPFDMDVILKRSCFVTAKQNKASWMDLVKAVYKRIFHRSRHRFAVLYENAKIERSWLCSHE